MRSVGDYVWVWEDSDHETGNLIRTKVKDINSSIYRNNVQCFYAVECDDAWRGEDELDSSKNLLIERTILNIKDTIRSDTGNMKVLLDEIEELNTYIKKNKSDVKKIKKLRDL
jgi:hypothetical protein